MTLDMALHPGVAMSGWEMKRADSVLARAADLGYTRVIVPLREFESLDAPKVREQFMRHGLRPMTAGNQTLDADISSDDARTRHAGESRLRRMIDFTRSIGGDQISGVLYGVLGHASGPISGERFRRTAALLGQLADEAATEGVRIVCEIVNRYETAMVNTSEQGRAFVEASHSNNLALHLDTFHMNIEERNPVEAVRWALPYLAYLEIGQNDRGALRGGSMDLSSFLTEAVRSGYRGRFGVEAFSAAVLEEPIAVALAVWRRTFERDNEIAEDGINLVRTAFQTNRDLS